MAPLSTACLSLEPYRPACPHAHTHPPTPIPAPQDRHALELKVARQRVKHLLYEQGAAVARLKAEGEAALKVQVRVGRRVGC